MNEHDALAKIKAKDWLNLDKAQTMEFMHNIFPSLNTDVAQKILLNNPNILTDYLKICESSGDKIHEIAKNALEKNHERAKSILNSMHALVETLNQLIADPNTSFEEKKFYIEKIQEAHSRMMEFDKDDKNFMLKLFYGVGIAVVAVVAIPLAIIFGKNDEHKDDTSGNSDDIDVNSL